MGRYAAAHRPTACPNASLPADRQSTGCRVERERLRPLILGQPARRRQRPSPRLSARSSERVAFAPPLPRKSAPSRTVGVGARKGSKLRITEIKAGSLGITRTIKVHSPSVLLQRVANRGSATLRPGPQLRRPRLRVQHAAIDPNANSASVIGSGAPGTGPPVSRPPHDEA